MSAPEVTLPPSATGRRPSPWLEAVFWAVVVVWLVLAVFAWRQGAVGFPIGVVVTDYPEPEAYPEILGSLVVGFTPAERAPHVGDRLVGVGAFDVRGLDPVQVVTRAWLARIETPDGFAVPLTYRRSGVDHRVTAVYPANRAVRWYLVTALVEMVIAIAVWMRARERPSARAFALATGVHAILLSGFPADSDVGAYVLCAIGFFATALVGPLVLRCVLLVPDDTVPTSRWPFRVVWTAALPALLWWQGLWPVRIASPEACLAAASAIYGALCFVGLGILVSHYGAAGERGRRQLRWALLGIAISVPAVVASGVILSVAPELAPLAGALHVATLATPVSVAIAIIWFDLFDIDRLISAASAYATTLFVLLAGGLVALSYGESAIEKRLGIERSTIRLTLAPAMAALAILAQRWVRPWIDRLFFGERFALRDGLMSLLSALDGSEGRGALLSRVGTALEQLARPTACAVYGLVGPRYVKVFPADESSDAIDSGASGFPADGPLAAALAAHPGVLALHGASERSSSRPDVFERAALETLGAAVVVPAKSRRLLAFVALGAKRSGDVFTATELALLSTVGQKLALELERAERVDESPASDVVHTVTESPRLQAVNDGPLHGENGAGPPADHLFKLTGDFWTISYGGKTLQLRDARGLRYLAQLLWHPRREFHASELIAAASSPPTGGRPVAARSYAENGVRIGAHLGDAGEPLDARAFREYRERISELRSEIEDAEAAGDTILASRATAELDTIVASLSATAGGRRVASHAERARQAVTKGIGAALEKIGASHPELGRHLQTTIKRGYFCSYNPDERVATDWQR